MALGMARRGFFVSSPSDADASNPAKDRNPNTMPRNSVLPPMSGGTVNMSSVRVCPPGAWPEATRTITTTAMSRISAVVLISTQSSVFIDVLTGATPSTREIATAPSAMTHGARPGVVAQSPRTRRKSAPKMPAVMAVVMMNDR